MERPAGSEPAFRPLFASRSLSGERRRISRHQRSTSSSRCSSGTTTLTSRISSACWAPYRRLRETTSRARFSPTVRVIVCAAHRIGAHPSRVPAWTETPDVPEIVRSAMTFISCPAPMQQPRTRRITGTPQPRISSSGAGRGAPARVSRARCASGRARRPRRRRPGSPAAVSTMTPPAGSSEASARSWQSSRTLLVRRAFRRRGRSIVMVARPPPTSTRMSSSPAVAGPAEAS